MAGNGDVIEVEIKFLVKKSSDQVFALISDVPNYWRWASGEGGFFIENTITSEGPIGLGTTYLDRLKWRGKAVGEIVEYQPPSAIRFEQRTVFGLTVFEAAIDYALEKSEQNFTVVTHKLTAKMCGVFKVLEPLLSRTIRAERERTCEAIKGALETNSGNLDAGVLRS